MTKEGIIEFVSQFGLSVDLDRWDDLGWIRFRNTFETTSDLVVHNDERTIQMKVKEYFINIGKDKIRNDFKRVLNG